MKSGGSMATIQKVADDSGFSIATVSRVLNNDPSLSVTDETRTKVYESALKVGYQKKVLQPLIKDVAFLYWMSEREELEDVYFRGMRLELAKQAMENNIELKTYTIDEGIEKIPKSIRGFIAVGAFTEKELVYLRDITDNGVFLDTSPDMSHYDSVRPDLYEITEKAVDFFLSKGHQDIGFIGGTFHDRNNDTEKMDIREKKFRNYMLEKNLLKENFIFVKRGFSFNTGVELMEEAISSLGDQLPTAFLIAADPIAIGCLQVINEKEISIPNRVSIISINDLNMTKYLSPPLTTFHIDMKELVKNAIQMLKEQILDNRTVRKKLFIESELVVRKSTKE